MICIVDLRRKVIVDKEKKADRQLGQLLTTLARIAASLEIIARK